MSPEKGFLDAILREPDEPTHRLVYAEWLDEQGDGRRAEFLRLEVRLRQGDGDPAILTRLRELLPEIGADWAAFFDRAAIAHCRYGRRCPGRWEALELTVKARVRLCSVCGRFIQHTRDPAEAVEQARQGHPVAVDSRVELPLLGFEIDPLGQPDDAVIQDYRDQVGRLGHGPGKRRRRSK